MLGFGEDYKQRTEKSSNCKSVRQPLSQYNPFPSNHPFTAVSFLQPPLYIFYYLLFLLLPVQSEQHPSTSTTFTAVLIPQQHPYNPFPPPTHPPPTIKSQDNTQIMSNFSYFFLKRTCYHCLQYNIQIQRVPPTSGSDIQNPDSALPSR